MIQGERIRLWCLEKFDVSKNYHWGNDPELIQLTGMNPLPKSMTDMERWYENVHTNPNLKLFTIKTFDGEYIGNIELNSIDWRGGGGELGIVIGERDYWHQGYGSEATHMMLGFAFGELRLHRIETRVLSHNQRAQHTFERCGFVKEGLLRQAHFAGNAHQDIVVYSMLSHEYQAP